MEEFLNFPNRGRDLGKKVRNDKKKHPSSFSDLDMNLNFIDEIV